ncbi:MAG: hypothetical protein Q8Q73_04370 [Stagnimonas sp.]|nr:hypothetical protein [Stagnimonas sp.]
MRFLSGIKTINRIWERLASGVLVPQGHVSERSRSASDTYLALKQKALDLEALYADAGVRIPAGGDLARLIESTKQLSDAWLQGRADKLPDQTLWDSAHLTRVADAALPLRGTPQEWAYLHKLTNGSLSLLKRESSEAKNFLWELELLHVLRAHGVQAKLQEPPDIVATFDAAEIGIACKKLYSTNNVEKVLSNGVAQIEGTYQFGIVAINLDDLTPEDSLFVANTERQMADQVNEINRSFLKENDRHFRKYLASGRLLSALVSTNVLADLRRESVRLNNARQSTVWMIPGLPAEKATVFEKFYATIMDRPAFRRHPGCHNSWQ